MTKAVNFFGTLILLLLANGALAFGLKTAFIDVSVMIGIASIVFVRMFTSPSNWARANRSVFSSSMETVQLDKKENLVEPRIILYACYAFTFVFLIVVIVTYFNYFIS
ncbi:hypothetical protein P6709_01645 [Jeotgalibacillus sp. ET6]|uniref:hypothetical protein n=1 Tax=Jeotgalibacillus sp. ET6 TaxID=3037260 RepID=UPI002418B658|nr:hypothetical protein [Jeotgalibacillus sp. ET6]MDG5470432.1 hypothetical protein [Jeotgalibacillus sp. ET6]